MTSLTFGKHKGEDIKCIPIGYLKWISETFSAGKVRDLVDAEINRREGIKVTSPEPKKPKQAKVKTTWQESMRHSHYEWADTRGQRHRIPNDVQMAGRDSEMCPFE